MHPDDLQLDRGISLQNNFAYEWHESFR